MLDGIQMSSAVFGFSYMFCLDAPDSPGPLVPQNLEI